LWFYYTRLEGKCQGLGVYKKRGVFWVKCQYATEKRLKKPRAERGAGLTAVI
jgi:hypothetical protein